MESIRLEDGKFPFLAYHQHRFDRTRQHFCKRGQPILLAEALTVPTEYTKGVYKVRVEYHCDIVEVSYIPYQVRSVKSLKLINGNHIDYAYKYADRLAINMLFAERGDCDDILMVKNGLITDTSYANVILHDGQYWYTPANPIMPGTCRARLMAEGKVLPADIYVEHLKDFKEVRLINAMMNIDQGPRVPIADVSMENF
ncbi:MAG: 4-amino-4-deoxychorismate lyase [Cyanothece sp. SIO1E1]|nr:4-amino-4-deoxychorismate lyase [Cyanothece sp. SIO1E1]